MAQEYLVTMTWMVLGELCRCLPVVGLLREFEGRLKVQAYCHHPGRAHCFDIKMGPLWIIRAG